MTTIDPIPPPLPAAGMKQCHRCAERVLEAAKVCRYCHAKLDIRELQTDVSYAAIQAIIAVGLLLVTLFLAWQYYTAMKSVVTPEP